MFYDSDFEPPPADFSFIAKLVQSNEENALGRKTKRGCLPYCSFTQLTRSPSHEALCHNEVPVGLTSPSSHGL